MELQAYVLGSIHLHATGGPITLVANLAVGGIVEQCDVLFPAVSDRRGQIFVGGDGAGRIVGVVQPHQLGGIGYRAGNGVQFGKPAVPFVQGHDVAFGAGKHGPHAVNGIGGVWNQGDVAWV